MQCIQPLVNEACYENNRRVLITAKLPHLFRKPHSGRIMPVAFVQDNINQEQINVLFHGIPVRVTDVASLQYIAVFITFSRNIYERIP